MSVVIIIFMIISTLFALATLAYVAIDIIIENRNKEEPKEDRNEVNIVVAPVIEEIVPEIMPQFVEHIEAQEADAMISDSLAMKSANYEVGAGHGKQAIINVGVLDENFEANELITIALLKQRGFIPKKAGRMKVLADGALNKPLTIKAESYSIQAIKMIELTGGTVVILKD